MNYLWVAAGSALGGMLRYWMASSIGRATGGSFPWGTLAVNVLGSAFIGWFASYTAPEGRMIVAPEMRLFVMTGICGGYTTFSTFSLETLRLAQDGEWSQAAANAGLSLILCLVGVWAGHTAAVAMGQR